MTANILHNENQDGASAPSTLPIIIAEWPKNSRETLRIRIDEFKGHAVIDIRAWYGEADNLKPGRGGLTVSIRHLPAIADALAKALAAAKAHGLVTDTEGGDL